MDRRSWTQQEDQAIVALVQQFGVMDWTNISQKLKQRYNINERTGKQCRQRWYNHLNPQVNKKPWTDEEEKLLFQIHRKSGNKWKLMSRYFQGRTDNDIKNHFYSTLRRSLRRLNKFIGEKNSTTQMREIKPSVLSTIMNYIYEQENNIQSNIVNSLKDLPYLIFQFSNYKPVKSKVKIQQDEQIKSKINFIFTLITKANTTYQVLKQNSRMVKNNKKCNNNDNENNINKKNMIKNDGTNINVSNCQNNNSQQQIPTHVQISSQQKYTSINNNNNNYNPTITTTNNNQFKNHILPTTQQDKLIQEQLDFIKYLPKKSNSHNLSIQLSPPLKKIKQKTVKIIKRQLQYSQIKMENQQHQRQRLIDVNKDIHTELIGQDMNIQHHADFLIKRDFQSDYNMSNTKRQSIQNLQQLTYQRTRRISLQAYEDFMQDEQIGQVQQPSQVGFYCPGSLDDLVVVGKQVVIHQIVGNTNQVKMQHHSDHSNIDQLIQMNYSH